MKFRTDAMRDLIDSLEAFEQSANEYGKLVGAAVDLEVGDTKVRATFDGIIWELKERDG